MTGNQFQTSFKTLRIVSIVINVLASTSDYEGNLRLAASRSVTMLVQPLVALSNGVRPETLPGGT